MNVKILKPALIIHCAEINLEQDDLVYLWAKLRLRTQGEEIVSMSSMEMKAI